MNLSFKNFLKCFFIILLISVLLLVALSACEKRENIIRENAVFYDIRKNIPENYVKPQFNGKVIATILPDEAMMPPKEIATNNATNPYISSYDLPISPLLKETMEKYSGEDVWFRVVIHIYSVPYSQEVKTFLNFLKDLGSTEIEQIKFSECVNSKTSYVTELNVEMINILFKSGKCQLMLAQYPRNPEHSKVISDSLSITLDRMNDTDCVEVVAVSAADEYNTYAEYQNVTVNLLYNFDRFRPYDGLNNITYAQYNKIIDKYLSYIIEKNNITEKIIVSDELPRVKKTIQYPTDFQMNNTYTGVGSSGRPIGFNAELTKAEILKLAEDEEIKVIYLAPERKMRFCGK